MVHNVVSSVFLYSEVSGEFELGHFFNFESSHHSYDLKQPFFTALDWLFDAELLTADSVFHIGL